jgi:signal peptidase II
VEPAARPIEPLPAGQGRRVLGWLVGVALLVLTLDLATKVAAVSSLEGRPSVSVVDGVVYLVLTRNTGAAFSFGQGYTIVLTLIALAVVGVIVRFARRLGSTPWAISLGMILGGAAGNLADRLFRAPGPFRGAVIDFISVFDDSGGVFPVFNVADSALVIGVLLAVGLELTGRQLNGTRVRHSQGDDTGDES